MKIRIFLLLAVIIFQILLSGCWDYSEYESMAHITALGIDFNKETNEITVTIQHIPTTKGGSAAEVSKPKASHVGVSHSATDSTYYEALIKLQQIIAKKLFFGYLKVIVIGENAAKYKMKDIMELHDRTPDIRNTAYIAIVRGKAEDTISTSDADGIISSSQEIFNLINLSSDTGTAYPVTVQDFTANMAILGLEAVAPNIITTSFQKQGLVAKGGIGDNIRADEERQGDQRISGMAVFKGDKLMGWLDNKESLGYGLISGKKLSTYKTSNISKETDSENKLYYHIINSKSKIKVQIDKDKPTITVNIDIKADLRKYYSNIGSDFLSQEEVASLEKKLSDSILYDINLTLNKAQKELKSDIFGFGFALFRKNPKLWKTKYEEKWDNIFPNIQVNINVSSKVINTGSNIRKLNLK